MVWSRLFDVRAGESRRVLRMFCLLGLVIATSYVLKPVRSSLFLSQFGSERLPYVYIVVALVLGVVAAGFARWTPRANLPRVYVGAAYFFASSMMMFWLAASSGWIWAGFAFYVWVSIVTALMPSLFWLLANYVFYANEGRRLFPVVMAGGLLGSIFGGGATSLLVPVVGTLGLLPVAALLLVVIGLLVGITASRERDRMSERRSDLARQERSRAFSGEENPFRLLRRSRYLSMLAALVVVTTLTSTLVDYQFNSVVEEAYGGRDALTRFFGGFFALINVLAFLLQILLAGRLLSRLGVAAGLLVLPLALFGTSLSFVLFPSLLTAALLKTADDGLSNSIHRASIEVLYLPIALSLKNRLKAWIDMFAERVSRGLGGLVILGATSLLLLRVSQIGFLVLALLVPWILLVLRLRREYVESLRQSLARRDIANLDSSLRDPASLEVFRQVLAGSDAKEISYALELVQGTDDPVILEDAERLAAHESGLVRGAALRVLRGASSPPSLSDFAERVRDEDVAAGAEAMALWLRADRDEAEKSLKALVQTGAVDRVSAVLDCVEGSETRLSQGLLAEIVERHGESVEPRSRRLAAKAVGLQDAGPEVERRATSLLADPDVEVARAAATSLGSLRSEKSFEALVSALERRPVRARARAALARYGPPAVARLQELLDEPSVPPGLRRALPRAIAEIEDQKSVEVLLRWLPNEEPRLHYQGVKSLARLRARAPSLHFSRSEVERLLAVERASLVDLSLHLAALRRARLPHDNMRLLLTVLEERIEFTRERLFRLLGLVYPQDEIAGLWNRVALGQPAVRAAALEYLANLLSRRHRDLHFPAIEAGSHPEALRHGTGLLGEPAPSLEDTLRALASSSDYWVAACAVALAGELDAPALEPVLLRSTDHQGAVVREAAEHALESRKARVDAERAK